MNVMFREIRRGEIEKIRARIAKKPAVVNEIFTGTRPKKDIGQSPLQVAVKCGQFEIIDLLLDHGADPDFMENRADQPADTNDYYFMPMSILHDAIMGVFGSLPYSEYERSENYVKLIAKLLALGADPDKESFPHPRTNTTTLPLDTLIWQADEILHRYEDRDSEREIEKYDAAKKHLFEILDLMKQYGVDFDRWLDCKFSDGSTNRMAYLDDFIPMEDRPYEYEFRGKIYKGVTKGDIDRRKEIRAALQEYFGVK